MSSSSSCEARAAVAAQRGQHPRTGAQDRRQIVGSLLRPRRPPGRAQRRRRPAPRRRTAVPLPPQEPMASVVSTSGVPPRSEAFGAPTPCAASGHRTDARGPPQAPNPRPPPRRRQRSAGAAGSERAQPSRRPDRPGTGRRRLSPDQPSKCLCERLRAPADPQGASRRAVRRVVQRRSPGTPGAHQEAKCSQVDHEFATCAQLAGRSQDPSLA